MSIGSVIDNPPGAPFISGCHVTQSGAQSVPSGADTVLDFDTSAYDYGSEFALATDRFTPNVNGLYLIVCKCSFAAAGANERIQLHLRIDGVQQWAQSVYAGGAGTAVLNAAGIEWVTTAQYIDVAARHDTGANKNCRAELSIQRIA